MVAALLKNAITNNHKSGVRNVLSSFYEMDRAVGRGNISYCLFFSVGIYRIKKYYDQRDKRWGYKFWKARVFPFCVSNALYSISLHTSHLGEAFKFVDYCVEYRLGGKKLFLDISMFGR